MLVNPMTFKQESGGGAGLPPLELHSGTNSYNQNTGGTLENGKLHVSTAAMGALLLPDIWDVSNHETWEFGFKTELEEGSVNHNPIFAQGSTSGSTYAAVPTIQYYNTDKKFVGGVPNGNSSWLHLMYTENTFEPENTYYVKFGWDGSEYYIDVSTDGNTWTREASEIDSTPCYYTASYKRIGLGRMYPNSNEYFSSGYIILPECYVKINNVKVWGN